MVDLIPFEKDRELNIMDLGCGTGNLTKRIKKDYPNAGITCRDISPKMLEVARLKLNDYPDIEYFVNHFYDLKFKNQYDVVLSSFSLHHLITDQDKKNFIKKSIIL